MTDDDDKTSQDIQTAIIRRVYAWMVVGGIAIGGVGGTGILRVDKFGKSDADLMERRLNHALIVEAWNIRKTMPPEATRKRIKAIEHCLEHNCQNFKSPTTEW